MHKVKVMVKVRVRFWVLGNEIIGNELWETDCNV